MPAKPNCMQLSSPSFLVVGLDNGNIAGWNLSTNALDQLPAHIGTHNGILCMKKFASFIMTGDRVGRVQVRNSTNNFALQFPET